MLIDTLLLPHNAAIMHRAHMCGFPAALTASQKFVLAPDFSFAADGLVENIPELKKVWPYCRIPYPITWLEFAQSERPHFNKNATAPDNVKPPRVGFLCVARKPSILSNFHAFLIWSLPRHSREQFSSSPFCIEINSLEEFPFPTIRLIQTDFGHYVRELYRPQYPTAAAFNSFFGNDWNGEFPFLVGILGLMNTRNATSLTKVDNSEWNLKRAKRALAPLASHHLISISTTIRKQISRTGGDPSSRQEARFHFVRGHFKVRASGIFWWNNFARGNPTRGTVTHDYSLTT